MDYRDQTPMYYSARESAAPMDAGLRAYMLHIYNLMASALALSGLAAYAAANWEPLRNALYTVHDGHIGLSGLGLIAAFSPLLIVWFGFGRINSISLSSAQIMFWVFAVLNGLSLSSLLMTYTGASVVRVFLVTTILFGSMSMWGYASKRDLSGMGHFMMMGLYGVLIAIIVNLFLQSSALDFALSVAGVAVFTGLTAWDTQKLKAMYYQLAGTGETAAKYAILGALNLYLDFVNMFIMLLRLFGDRRN